MLGLIMFNFFSQAVSSSVDLIRNNSGYIKSIKIPYEVFILSTVFQSIFSHIFELSLVVILFLFFHLSLIGIFWYVFIFILFAIFTLGLCFLFATIGLYFSDFGNIWSIISQLLFFITPVFYVINNENHIYLSNLFNPLSYFLTVARDATIYSNLPSAWSILLIVLIASLSLTIGLFFFTKFKQRFAEYI
jgi:ABC-type polysaccharide/polyol phosphate export permease